MEVLRFYHGFTQSAPEELTAYAALLHTPDGVPAVAVIACYCGDLAAGEQVLRPLRNFSSPIADMIQPMPFPQMQTLLDAAFPDGNYNYWRLASDLLWERPSLFFLCIISMFIVAIRSGFGWSTSIQVNRLEMMCSSKTMSQVYRFEVPWHQRFGSPEGAPRFVVVVEIPDQVISALENPGLSELQLKARGIAMNATWNQRVKFRNFRFSSWSSSVVVDGNPADYGAASYKAEDGSSAWIVESPFGPRHACLTLAECQNARELPPAVV